MSSDPRPRHTPEQVLGSLDVQQVIDRDGVVVDEALEPDLAEEELLGLYHDIKLARAFDRRASSLQRQGRMAAYAPMTGQEGAQVAACYALRPSDWLLPTYRDHAAKFVQGMPLSGVLSPLMGTTDGYAVPEDVNVLPEYIPVATQIVQAPGIAWGMRASDTDDVVMCMFGDGATSHGDFHEGLNFAGVLDVPVVFLCNNNQWAISVPVSRQTASDTIAQKADAYGMAGAAVDGMDPLAVYAVVRRAVERARRPADGEGRPTLIESVQYRYGPHTSADDPARYREDVTEAWRAWDPLERLGRYLRRDGIIDDAIEARIDREVEEQLDRAVTEAESIADRPAELFEHVFAQPTPRLRRQRDELAGRLTEVRGDGGDDPAR